ncbi:hypothetical protein NL676_012294 [Syzygium grande]|nr:hypothetical protein NL676_012294 [Syzygium grande]
MAESAESKEDRCGFMARASAGAAAYRATIDRRIRTHLFAQLEPDERDREREITLDVEAEEPQTSKLESSSPSAVPEEEAVPRPTRAGLWSYSSRSCHTSSADDAASHQNVDLDGGCRISPDDGAEGRRPSTAPPSCPPSTPFTTRPFTSLTAAGSVNPIYPRPPAREVPPTPPSSPSK